MGISTGAGMKRRKFITLMGGAAVWPLIAYAQEPKVRRVGALLIGNADMESFQYELREGLRELGYIEGQNILFEFRSAEGILDRLPGLWRVRSEPPWKKFGPSPDAGATNLD
jgi:putative tryptophan/tyrosine transport system substrate-binding protein